MKKKTLVVVTWVDAVGSDGWVDDKHLKSIKLYDADTVGYVVRDDESSILITMTYDDEGENHGAYMCIPKFAIKKIRQIK